MIGKSVPRVDAYEKVTGRAKFTDDLILNKCLVARVYHAKIGNGVVKSIDTSEAEALDGVVKVVTFKDVPNHCYPTPGHPWSVELAHQDVADRNLLTGRVRYYGDDIAAVVAEKRRTSIRCQSGSNADIQKTLYSYDTANSAADNLPGQILCPEAHKYAFY